MNFPFLWSCTAKLANTQQWKHRIANQVNFSISLPLSLSLIAYFVVFLIATFHTNNNMHVCLHAFDSLIQIFPFPFMLRACVYTSMHNALPSIFIVLVLMEISLWLLNIRSCNIKMQVHVFILLNYNGILMKSRIPK